MPRKQYGSGNIRFLECRHPDGNRSRYTSTTTRDTSAWRKPARTDLPDQRRSKGMERVHAYLVHPSGIYPDRPLQRYPRNQIRLPGFGKERAGSIIERSEDFPQRYIGVLHIPAYRIPSDGTRRWEKVFTTAREWGLNHLRFHSWCPPKAAFEVADSLGFYLQVELPLWSTNLCKDKRAPYLYAEADRILEEYGNHPSSVYSALETSCNMTSSSWAHS